MTEVKHMTAEHFRATVKGVIDSGVTGQKIDDTMGFSAKSAQGWADGTKRAPYPAAREGLAVKIQALTAK